MKAAAAVPSLSKILGQGPPELRLVAVAALAQIASPGAMQALDKAIEDEDSDVRVAAVKVIAANGHAPSVGRIEAQLKKKEVREAPLAEKMAFFESYGMLSGDAGIDFLDGILNSRSFLGKRESAELRACAAVALGKIGSDTAIKALRGSANDSDVIVRNAVSRAVRGG
jgi:HEAT repeat protein